MDFLMIILILILGSALVLVSLYARKIKRELDNTEDERSKAICNFNKELQLWKDLNAEKVDHVQRKREKLAKCLTWDELQWWLQEHGSDLSVEEIFWDILLYREPIVFAKCKGAEIAAHTSLSSVRKFHLVPKEKWSEDLKREYEEYLASDKGAQSAHEDAKDELLEMYWAQDLFFATYGRERQRALQSKKETVKTDGGIA